MHVDPKLARVWELAEPIALEAGLEVVDIEHRREGRGTVLRLLIDQRGGDAATGRVSLEQLTSVSRQLSALLDVHEGVVRGTYTLEVSSPGVNRPLTKPEHFSPFVGRNVHVRTRRPLGERHTFRGVLAAVAADGITVTTDDGRNHEIPFVEIARANYQHDFAPPLSSRKRSLHRHGGSARRRDASR